MTCLSYCTCRIQNRAQGPLRIGAGQSPSLILRAPAGGSGPAASPRRGRAVILAVPQGARSGAQALCRARQSPCPILGAPAEGSGLVASLHQAGWSPHLILGAPTWGSGPAASPCKAGWSPHPLLRAPTGDSGPVASPRRARRSFWLCLRAPAVGLRFGGLSASGRVVTPSFPQGARRGLRPGALSTSEPDGHPVPSSGRPQGAQARRGHTAYPSLLLALGPAGCHLSTSVPRLPPG